MANLILSAYAAWLAGHVLVGTTIGFVEGVTKANNEYIRWGSLNPHVITKCSIEGMLDGLIVGYIPLTSPALCVIWAKENLYYE